MVLEAAKLAYADKIKESITSRKFGPSWLRGVVSSI